MAYYPIALTSGGVVTTLLDTVDLAVAVAETYAAAVVRCTSRRTGP